jgi:predicted phosphodiesterase
MRTAILSDIHGNLTAFEAVLADLDLTAPDLVLHGGDLADSGSSPIEIVDRIRELGWQGVLGNTDEMLFDPTSLEAFAAQSKAPPAIWDAVRDIASATRDLLGPDRLAWLRTLPRVHAGADFALTHATPTSCWQAPPPNASDTDLEAIYSPLGKPTVVFAHTHVPSIRHLSGCLLVNTGSIGLSYDSDPRASYLLLDDATPSIRRVPYDLNRELQHLAASGRPGASWTTRMLRASSPQLP